MCMWFSTFFEKRIGEPREPAHVHPHREVLPLRIGRADVRQIGRTFDGVLAGSDCTLLGRRRNTCSAAQIALLCACPFPVRSAAVPAFEQNRKVNWVAPKFMHTHEKFRMRPGPARANSLFTVSKR